MGVALQDERVEINCRKHSAHDFSDDVWLHIQGERRRWKLRLALVRCKRRWILRCCYLCSLLYMLVPPSFGSARIEEKKKRRSRNNCIGFRLHIIQMKDRMQMTTITYISGVESAR